MTGRNVRSMLKMEWSLYRFGHGVFHVKRESIITGQLAGTYSGVPTLALICVALMVSV